MSHQAQMSFVGSVKSRFPSHFDNQKVLEIGSLDINGTVRTQFTSCEYIGVDVGGGAGVDVVCNGADLAYPDNSFDTSISCECFEHNPQWVETFQNMIRMVKPSGLIIMTCATEGRGEHGTSRTLPADSPLTVGLGWDYYRNLTEADFREHFDFEALFSSYGFVTNDHPRDLYFWGIKK